MKLELVSFISIILIIVCPLHAQVADTIVPNVVKGSFSAGLSYSGFTDEINADLSHKERDFIVNVGYNLSNRLMAVLQSNIVRSNFDSSPNERSTALVFSGSMQYDFIPLSVHRFFGQLGVGRGNYCTCGENLPTFDSGLIYLQFGIGLNARIWRDVYLDLAFEANPILSNAKNKYYYNVGTVGLHFKNLFSISN